MPPTFPIDEPDDTSPLERFYAREALEDMTDDELHELVALHREERAMRQRKAEAKEARKRDKAENPAPKRRGKGA